ncbi:MAG: MdtA/MuxA family multidrug efflux RND transporter periplasmic adaptor subunit [Alphaproteobacteria bacterium]|nr:MdtA/MuxA family multidrug efflux RND transporter periplasmic adaptor subunit [Alphaproteobacteria bacterium]
MDDQRSEIVVHRSRAEVDGGAARFEFERPGLRPADVVQRPLSRSWLRWLFWLLLVLAIIGAVVWYYHRPEGQPKTGGRNQFGGPIPVGVATVQKGDMPVTLTGLGTVTPLATVTVKTQINGYLTEVAFQEGQMVKKGDFLAQIDPRPYQVALEQAEGQLAKDQALLKNAQLDLQRYNTLVAQNSIATQTRDTQISLVAQDQAAIKTDQAQVDAQKLNLVYAHIVSPVTGRVGLRQVDAGNYVQTSDPNGIVIVTQLQPISVIFTLPEDNLPAVIKQLHAGASLTATAYDRTSTTELGKGHLETVDNQIDTTTGTVKLRAIFDNDQEILFPNQFVNVQLLVNTMKGVDIVPTAAIQHGAPGAFVYVIKPDQTAAVQQVKLGPGDGQQIAVLDGLQPGEQVVVDGADRLREGAKVTLAATSNPTGTALDAKQDKAQPQAAGGQGASSPVDPQAPAGRGATQPHAQQQGEGKDRGRRRDTQ